MDTPKHDPSQDRPSDAAPGAASQTLQHFNHDIRAAMSDVIGGLRLVDRRRLDPEAQIQIDRVQAAADTLAALIDGALMAVAGESPVRPDRALVVLEDWLATVAARWSGSAMQAGRRFDLRRAGELPACLHLSQVVLDRIIGNLIANALTHAPAGPVTLHLSAAPGGGMVLAVLDQGPGFSDPVPGQLVPAGAAVGHGLGLRIAADLARQAGASLDLSNTPTGAKAALQLPEALLGWKTAPPGPVPLPDLRGLRMLVAEDNLTNQAILRQMLDQMRADAVFVSDGVAALDMLDHGRFDIALIDIEMPRLSGLQVMQAARARGDDVARMPMVALTAYVLRDNREAIYAAGADGIIGKPISSVADFGRAILRYTGRPTDLPEPQDILTGEASLGHKMDRARFDALLAAAGAAGSADLLARVTEDLCAVNEALDAALGQGDLAGIRAQTHILIAISGAVGADRLYRLAEVLNIAAKRRQRADLAALYAPVRADLVDLIAFVGSRSA